MPHSPYLNLDRDLETLKQIVRDHEASKPAPRVPARSAGSDAVGNKWEPSYPTPVALAS